MSHLSGDMYRDFQRTESRNTMNLTQAPQYVPDEAAATSLLQYLTAEQLQEYLNDESKFDAIISDLPQRKNMIKDQENTIVKNKSLAEYNISLQPKFENLKAEVATSYERINSLKMSLGQDVAKLESMAGNQSQDTMLAIFQTEAATADENSEELASRFCDGNIDVETFISDYLPHRTDAYNKKSKLEKLTDMFRHGETGLEQAPYPVTQNMPSKTLPGHPNTSMGYGASYRAPYPPANQYGGMPNLYR